MFLGQPASFHQMRQLDLNSLDLIERYCIHRAIVEPGASLAHRRAGRPARGSGRQESLIVFKAEGLSIKYPGMVTLTAGDGRYTGKAVSETKQC